MIYATGNSFSKASSAAVVARSMLWEGRTYILWFSFGVYFPPCSTHLHPSHHHLQVQNIPSCIYFLQLVRKLCSSWCPARRSYHYVVDGWWMNGGGGWVEESLLILPSAFSDEDALKLLCKSRSAPLWHMMPTYSWSFNFTSTPCANEDRVPNEWTIVRQTEQRERSVRLWLIIHHHTTDTVVATYASDSLEICAIAAQNEAHWKLGCN